MKVINVQETDLNNCLRSAQRQGVVITRKGKPIAVMFGVKDMDLEQLERSYSDEFWQTIAQRRKQKTISRAELERRLAKAGGKGD